MANNITKISAGKDKKRYNRCKKKNGGCSQKCRRNGKQKCSCLTGFQLMSDEKTCEGKKINNNISKALGIALYTLFLTMSLALFLKSYLGLLRSQLFGK